MRPISEITSRSTESGEPSHARERRWPADLQINVNSRRPVMRVVRPTDRASSIACGSSLTEALTRFLELIEAPVVVGASPPRAGFSPFATT